MDARLGGQALPAADGVLIEQGVPVDAVFILLEGKLAVSFKPKRDPEREIAGLNAGEIVEEMSFVDARPPSATVRAVEDSTGLRHLQGRPEREAGGRPGLRGAIL